MSDNKYELLRTLSAWLRMSILHPELDYQEYFEDIDRLAKNNPNIALVSEELKNEFLQLVNTIKQIQ